MADRRTPGGTKRLSAKLTNADVIQAHAAEAAASTPAAEPTPTKSDRGVFGFVKAKILPGSSKSSETPKKAHPAPVPHTASAAPTITAPPAVLAPTDDSSSRSNSISSASGSSTNVAVLAVPPPVCPPSENEDSLTEADIEVKLPPCPPEKKIGIEQMLGATVSPAMLPYLHLIDNRVSFLLDVEGYRRTADPLQPIGTDVYARYIASSAPMPIPLPPGVQLQIELTLFNAEKDLFDQAFIEVTKQIRQNEKFPELAKRILQTLVLQELIKAGRTALFGSVMDVLLQTYKSEYEEEGSDAVQGREWVSASLREGVTLQTCARGDQPPIVRGSGNVALSPKALMDVLCGSDEEKRKWLESYESSKSMLECSNLAVLHTLWKVRAIGHRKRDAVIARVAVPPVAFYAS